MSEFHPHPTMQGMLQDKKILTAESAPNIPGKSLGLAGSGHDSSGSGNVAQPDSITRPAEEGEKMMTADDTMSLALKCPVCRKQCTNGRYIIQHLKHLCGSAFRKCSYCQQQFSTRRAYKLHLETHSGEEQDCLLGGQQGFGQTCESQIVTPTPRARKVHCQVCNSSCKSLAEYIPHLEAHLAAYIPPLETNLANTMPSAFICSICNRGFATKYTLKTHEERHVGRVAEPFNCIYCRKTYKMVCHFKRHMEMIHSKRICENTGKLL